MRDVSDEMRNAASDLRRQNPAQANASARRALEGLRDVERQIQGARPDEQRRALGEMQLEARQLADAQRQIASELAKTGEGDAAKDAVRRLAGDQERLSERTRRLRDALKQQAGRSGRPVPDPPGSSRNADPSGATTGAQAQATAADAARDIDRQRLPDRMQQAADAMRAAAERGAGMQRGNTAPVTPSGELRSQAAAQNGMARELEKLADKLASTTRAKDGESRKLSDQLARVQAQRDRLNAASRALEQAGREGQSGTRGADGSTRAGSRQKAAGEDGKPGEGRQGGGSGSDLARMREEYMRQLQQTRDLLNQLGREDESFTHGGPGFTFEGRGMTMSAPGTEAFKQDFSRWDDLKRQATQALDAAESSISKKLQAKQARDRLAVGADDAAPPAYRKQVDSYFKAIAGKKKP
jgi:hypothetical protein